MTHSLDSIVHKFRFICILVSQSLILLTLFLLSGCSQEAAAPTEPVIPAHFTTYTDETNIFSISYPEDWTLALSMIEDLDKFSEDLIESLETGLPLVRTSTLFFAGLWNGTGYNSNVNIVVTPLPQGHWSLDKGVEAGLEVVKKVVQDYREYSRVKVTLGKQEAIITDMEYTIPNLGRHRSVQMATLKGDILWTITCFSNPENFDEHKSDFDSIVRSFRILK